MGAADERDGLHEHHCHQKAKEDGHDDQDAIHAIHSASPPPSSSQQRWV